MILGMVAHAVDAGLVDPELEAPERRLDATMVGGAQGRRVGEAMQQRQQVDRVEIGAVTALLEKVACQPDRLRLDEPRTPDLHGREGAHHLLRHQRGVGEPLVTARVVGIGGGLRGRADAVGPQPNLAFDAERRPVGRTQPKPPAFLEGKGGAVVPGGTAREARRLSRGDPQLRRRNRTLGLPHPAVAGEHRVRRRRHHLREDVQGRRRRAVEPEPHGPVRKLEPPHREPRHLLRRAPPPGGRHPAERQPRQHLRRHAHPQAQRQPCLTPSDHAAVHPQVVPAGRQRQDQRDGRGLDVLKSGVRENPHAVQPHLRRADREQVAGRLLRGLGHEAGICPGVHPRRGEVEEAEIDDLILVGRRVVPSRPRGRPLSEQRRTAPGSPLLRRQPLVDLHFEPERIGRVADGPPAVAAERRSVRPNDFPEVRQDGAHGAGPQPVPNLSRRAEGVVRRGGLGHGAPIARASGARGVIP